MVMSRASTGVLIPKDGNGTDHHHHLHQQRRDDHQRSSTNIWIEPNKAIVVDSLNNRKVPVIYYLSRNGQLEHPHFVQVPLSSSHGLYLRDVINRLNALRGDGLGFMYSWSSKRSYKNGYVWQDLSEDDLIHPTNGHDYVLKGSEVLRTSISETSPSAAKICDPSPVIAASRRRKNQSWSSFENAEDRSEYIVLKCESSRELAGKYSMAADASTQTEEKRWRREKTVVEEHCNKSVELNREELSPPPSMASSEGSDGVDPTATASRECNSIGKMRASSKVLMQLISCGSLMAFKHYGPVKCKESKTKAHFHT